MPRGGRREGGTRPKGNGAGYGGPAKGPQPRGEQMTLEEAIAKFLAMSPEERKAIKARREAQAYMLAERLFDVAMVSEMQASNASSTFIRITGLMPADEVNTNVNMTGETVDRPPPETREQWDERRRRERDIALGTASRATD